MIFTSVATGRSLFWVTTNTSIFRRSSCSLRAQAMRGMARARRTAKVSRGTNQSSAHMASGVAGGAKKVTRQPRSCIQLANFKLFSSSPPRRPERHKTASCGRDASHSWGAGPGVGCPEKGNGFIAQKDRKCGALEW